MSQEKLSEQIVNETAVFIEGMNYSDNNGTAERYIKEIISMGRGGYIDTVVFRGNASSINKIARMVDRAKEFLNKPPTVAAQIFYMIGVTVVEMIRESDQSPDSIIADDVLTKKFIEEMSEYKRLLMLRELHRVMPLEDFVAWCKEYPAQSAGYEKLIVENTWRNKKMKDTKRYISFLHETIGGNNESIKFDRAAIIKQARDQGLITNDKEEHAFINHASRCGISATGKRNVWQWCDKAEFDYNDNHK